MVERDLDAPDEWWAVCRNRDGLILAVWGPYTMRETAQMVAREKGGEQRGVTIRLGPPAIEEKHHADRSCRSQ